MAGIVAVAACIALWTLTAAGQISLPGGLCYEFLSRAGEHCDETIDISNTTDESVEVSITQVDYLFFADGTNIYADPGSDKRSNASWITVCAPDRLVIPARDTMAMNFLIRIPDDPSLCGTYWSMFLVSPVANAADSSARGEGIGLHVAVQYGIQIITHIGDTGERKIEVIAADLTRPEDGTPLLLVDVENVGERWVRPESWVEIFDESGAVVVRIDGARLRIFPGTSVRFRFGLPALDPGAYKALIVFDNALLDENIWGLQVALNL